MHVSERSKRKRPSFHFDIHLTYFFLALNSLDGQITNIIFWAVAILVGLSVFGYQVEALLITTAGLLVSFSFMISAASSKYVEVCQSLLNAFLLLCIFQQKHL